MSPEEENTTRILENSQQRQIFEEPYRINSALEAQREASGHIEGLLKYVIQIFKSPSDTPQVT